jgi:magnesium-transporting ATPase (P-type)
MAPEFALQEICIEKNGEMRKYAVNLNDYMNQVKQIKNRFLSRYSDKSFIIQQKAYIFFWIILVVIFLVAAISILNVTTAISTHPVIITASNIVLIIAAVSSLFFCITAAMVSRLRSRSWR